MRKYFIFIIDVQTFLPLIWDASFLKFYLKSIAIYDLKESTTKILMNFHCCSNYLICSLVPLIYHIIICEKQLSVKICVICG